MANLLSRLDELERTYDQLTRDLASTEVLADSQRYTHTAKRHAELADVVGAYREYRAVTGDAQAARELSDEAGADDRELLRAEAEELQARAAALLERLQVLLLPRDPLDDKNVIVE